MPSDTLPNDLAAAYAMIMAEHAARLEAEAAAAGARAISSSTDTLIARLKLEIKKLITQVSFDRVAGRRSLTVRPPNAAG